MRLKSMLLCAILISIPGGVFGEDQHIEMENTTTADEIEDMFEFKDADTRDFVMRHAALWSFYAEIERKVSQYFDNVVGIVVHLRPGSLPGRHGLFFYVVTTNDAVVAMEQVDQFDKEWWIEASGSVDEFLDVYVDVEFAEGETEEKTEEKVEWYDKTMKECHRMEIEIRELKDRIQRVEMTRDVLIEILRTVVERIK